MNDFIPYGKQSIDEQDIAAVVQTLKSDFLTCGPKVDEFELACAKFVGAKHAIAVNNATSALHLAMMVAGVGVGDRVVTSPNTFLSSANSAAFVGATPDFVDIDPQTYNLCAKSLSENWQNDTKVVIPVAYAGQSADMPEIAKIAREKNAIVIEDAAHGTGGGFEVNGVAYKQGGHPWADMTIFSFHPVKTLTTGEGGMIVTDNDEFAAKARSLRSHGMTRDSNEFQGLGSQDTALTEQGPWYYEMTELGHNFRITDIQCALGISQLSRLAEFTARRREIVARYNAAFENCDYIITPKTLRPNDAPHISWHLYTALFDFTALSKTRTEVILELREQFVGSQVLYIPVYLQPFYRNTYGYAAGKCPNAETYYANALSLPLFPSMTNADVQRVIKAVKRIVSK
jgi:perosamine synthetase